MARKGRLTLEHKVTELLREVEERISAHALKTLHNRIGVSIQLLPVSKEHQATPCNELCQRLVQEKAIHKECGTSCLQMKKILRKCYDLRPAGRFYSIGYKCHQKLSNLLLGYVDREYIGSISKPIWWYIFLGQCLVVLDKNKMQLEMLTKYDISILDKNHIDSLDDSSVPAVIQGFYHTEEEKAELFADKLSMLAKSNFDISDIVVLKTATEARFEEFMHGLRPKQVREIKDYYNKYKRMKKIGIPKSVDNITEVEAQYYELYFVPALQNYANVERSGKKHLIFGKLVVIDSNGMLSVRRDLAKQTFIRYKIMLNNKHTVKLIKACSDAPRLSSSDVIYVSLKDLFEKMTLDGILYD